MPKITVVHFVTGGFSGSTTVAAQLCKPSSVDLGVSAHLVLRRKRSTTPERIQRLTDEGISVGVIAGWSHIATILSLFFFCRKVKPDVLVCHGFSEHLWGRYAGLLAGVPHLVHVEHNSRERYGFFRLAQARWLARFTSKIVGCSVGVKDALLERGFPSDKLIAIENGIDLSAYHLDDYTAFKSRKPGIVMASRFAKQKDHMTLIQAIDLLRAKKLYPTVYFAGLGGKRYIASAKKAVQTLKLQDQIQFIGFCSNVSDLLLQNQLCVLCTHYEGMPLSLCEGMAAGCAVIGSEVVGVREMIRHGEDGILVQHQSASALASAIETMLTDLPYAERLAENARQRARTEFGVALMETRYTELYYALMGERMVESHANEG